MSLNRRQFLRLAGIGAAGTLAAGCHPIVSRVAGGPTRINGWSDWGGDPVYRALSRMTYGPTGAERARVQAIGLAGWIEEQLAFDQIEDRSAEIRVSPYDLLALDADELRGWEEDEVNGQLRQATLLRRVYSNRQLYETMVEFWTDHFNIAVAKENCWYLKVVDDRDVIRPGALGRFEDLLQASAKSPAMLIYLDNQANVKSHPNENYAREVMELHTLGVDGGYTQQDVMALSRVLTGWGVKENWWHGRFQFSEELHDSEPKIVLGERFDQGGVSEGEAALTMLSRHASTAEYLVTKLVRRFITDEPARDAADLVQKGVSAFQRTDGDIEAVMRVILLDGLAQMAEVPLKFKRPVQFVAGALRQLGAETDGGRAIQSELAWMGQPDFGWPTPDGPPDFSAAWMRDLLPRWRFAVSLMTDGYRGTRVRWDPELIDSVGTVEQLVQHLSDLLLGRSMPESEATHLLAGLDESTRADLSQAFPLIAAGLVGSPAYQWR